MAADDRTPLDPDPDPTEGDEEPEAEETAEADDQPGSDQPDEIASLRGENARLAQELEMFRRQATEADDEAGGEDSSSDDFLARATQDSWALAERLHGAEAIDAYRVAFRLVERAQTPADHVTAFEAYHKIRSGELPAPASGKAGDKAKAPTRAEATAPRVDANRSDPGSDLANAQEQIVEAKRKGSLPGFAAAAAAAMGFGPAKR